VLSRLTARLTDDTPTTPEPGLRRLGGVQEVIVRRLIAPACLGPVV